MGRGRGGSKWLKLKEKGRRREAKRAVKIHLLTIVVITTIIGCV
jgi:hypothetical protein